MALEIGNTQAFDTEGLVLLGAGGNLDDCRAFQCRDFNLSSKYRCDKLNWNVTDDILPLTLEDRVWLDGNCHIEIAWRASIDPVFPFIREA